MQKMESDSEEYRPMEPRMVKGQRNQADVIRDIVAIVCEERRWTTARLAQEIGVAQSGLHRFVSADTDARVELLTRLCAGLDETPVELFARHPVYSSPRMADLRHAMLADRLTHKLSPDEASELTLFVDEARNLGCYAAVRAAIRATLDAARIVRDSKDTPPRFK